MKLEIVKFKNGKYAVRKSGFFIDTGYKSLKEDYWWSIEFAYEYCQGTLEEIKEVYNRLTDYGTPIKLTKKKE
jgi:hypothetical protein